MLLVASGQRLPTRHEVFGLLHVSAMLFFREQGEDAGAQTKTESSPRRWDAIEARASNDVPGLHPSRCRPRFGVAGPASEPGSQPFAVRFLRPTLPLQVCSSLNFQLSSFDRLMGSRARPRETKESSWRVLRRPHPPSPPLESSTFWPEMSGQLSARNPFSTPSPQGQLI